ncbi:MAG: patatin-like phospholipase family protein, partial [Burkholderiales bacterium]
RTPISLVLGSGGARGLAHIGVIQWLTENGYEIRSIAGSSMGALVGGIHAASRLDVYAEWVITLERMQMVRLLDPAFGRAGLFKGERIIGVLRELIGDFEIEALPISFTAVAADLVSGEEVWLREGKLFDAIRASIAAPPIFTPFEVGGRKLRDGAWANPVPIGATLDDMTELTVVVSLSGPIALGPSQFQSARIPDVTVEIPRNACGPHEFWRAEELIALGRERTAQAFVTPPRTDTTDDSSCLANA